MPRPTLVSTLSKTMMIRGFLLLGLVLDAVPATAHQTPIHRRLTQSAMEKSPAFRRFLFENRNTLPVTSRRFVRNQLLANADLLQGNEVFSRAGTSPKNLVTLGSILEDRDPYFCNHFYEPELENPGHGRGLHDTGAGLTLCRNATPVSADVWVTDPRNDYNWNVAVQEMGEAFRVTGARGRAQHLETAFVALGGVLHLVEDMSQPSHTRNDAHGMCGLLGDASGYTSEWECWEMDPAHQSRACTGLASMSVTRTETSPNTAIDRLARYSSREFLSDHTIPQPLSPAGPSPAPFRVDGHFLRNSQGSPVAYRHGTDDRPRGVFGLHAPHDEVLLAYSRSLLPAAVTTCAEVLNYFFRCHLALDATENREPDQTVYTFVVTNQTAPGAEGAGEGILRNLDPQSLQILYLRPGGKATPISGWSVIGGTVGQGIEPGRSATLRWVTRDRAGVRPSAWLMIYTGQVGSMSGFAVVKSRQHKFNSEHVRLVRQSLPPKRVSPGDNLECLFGITVKDTETGKWVAPPQDLVIRAEAQGIYTYVTHDPKLTGPDGGAGRRVGLLPLNRGVWAVTVEVPLGEVQFHGAASDFTETDRTHGRCIPADPLVLKLPECAVRRGTIRLRTLPSGRVRSMRAAGASEVTGPHSADCAGSR